MIHPSAGRTSPTTVPASPADITEELFAVFAGRLSLSTIARVVRHCHLELQMAHGPVPLAALRALCLQRLRSAAPPPSDPRPPAAVGGDDPRNAGPDVYWVPSRPTPVPAPRVAVDDAKDAPPGGPAPGSAAAPAGGDRVT